MTGNVEVQVVIVFYHHMLLHLYVMKEPLYLMFLKILVTHAEFEEVAE